MTHPAVMDAPLRRDWGESTALFAAVVLFSVLRNRYTLGPPAVTWTIGALIVVAFLLSLFSTVFGERKQTRWLMSGAALILATGVTLSLIKVVYLVVYEAATVDGIRLLETSLLIWFDNVVVFAIIFHLMGERAFSFPRPEGQPPDAPMNFLDYVFLSFTTATAFSPTDMSPLTTRARMCMMLESMLSLVAIAIAAARAINILPQ